jgi:uncharacterized protein involved in outer membrane biogenesis
LATPWTDTTAGPLKRAGDEVARQYRRARREWGWRGFFDWFAIAFVSGFVVLLLVFIMLDWNTMRGPFGRFASARLGREVRIEGNLKVHWFSLTPWLEAQDVRLGNPAWVGTPEMGHADRLIIKAKLFSLLFGDPVFPLVEADRPAVGFVRDAQGHANWDFSGRRSSDPPAFKLPPILRLIINDGRVTLADAKAKLSLDGTFSSHEEIAGKRTDLFVFDGAGTLRGSPLTVSVRGGPLVHVDPDKPYALSVDLHHGATHVVADGALARPFDLGHLSAATTISGPSLADLYFLTGLAMPNTASYRLKGAFIREGHFYRFARFGGTVGKSDLAGEMSVDTTSGRPFLKAALASRSLAFSDLGPLIGSTPGGTTARVKTAAGGTRTVVTTARVLPDMPLRVERVRGMDAVVDYRAGSIRSQDFPLRQLVLHLSLDHGVMRFNPITFSFPQGRLSGTATIDARGRTPINDVDARVTNVQLGQFFGGAHPLIDGLLEARAKLHGPGDSIHNAAANATGTVTLVVPSGTVRKAYAELSGINITPGLFELLGNDKSDTNLRCGVAHFSARGGSLVSEQLVVDTDPVQIRGNGTLNLVTEQLSFRIQGYPKSFKLIRLRSPVLIGGTLADPHVGIQAGGAVAQGGLAVLLGAVLSPLAAILPFVDPGLAKDANCTALLSGAKAQGAPVKARSIAAAAQPRK